MSLGLSTLDLLSEWRFTHTLQLMLSHGLKAKSAEFNYL